MTNGEKAAICTTMFKYLGLIIQSDVEIDGDVIIIYKRVDPSGEQLWGCYICDKKFLSRLKINFTEMQSGLSFCMRQSFARTEDFRT